MADTEPRKIKTGTLHRSATFERAAINEEARTVDLAFSSEASSRSCISNSTFSRLVLLI